MSRRIDVATRFWPKVDRSGGPEACWLWTASLHDTGYGQLRVGNRPITAHRLAYELTYGPIPPGYDICHHCDIRPCVNPTHLFLGTRLDNMRDASMKGRTARGERNPEAKYSDDFVALVRARYEQGTSQANLCREFGLYSSWVSRVVRYLDRPKPTAPGYRDLPASLRTVRPHALQEVRP